MPVMGWDTHRIALPQKVKVSNTELDGLAFWGVFRPFVGMASTWQHIKYYFID